MEQIHMLLMCQCCRVYLVNIKENHNHMNSKHTNPAIQQESVEFDIVLERNREDFEVKQPSLEEVRRIEPDYVHFAEKVASTGQTINWSSVDNFTNCSITDVNGRSNCNAANVLSVPISSSSGQIIGVAQLIDKCDGQSFTEADVHMFEAFSIFCGLGIHNTQMYENAVKLTAKQKVALEVLSFHASSTVEEANTLVNASIKSAMEYNLYSFSFNDIALSEVETPAAALRMFIDLELIQKFHIPYQVLCRWILSVKKNYRPVTYHNWRHALNVTQTMFAMLTTGQLKLIISDLEILSLIVACLAHDLDHRGTNNSFQTKTESPLAILYSTSTMEHHHFDQCVMILNSEGNNIFQSLSPENYKQAIHFIEHAILSTDLAQYTKKKSAFLKLVETNDCNWRSSENREMLRGMMMTACDIAAICKPWEVQKRVAELVASEFFEQGDIEKQKLKEQPIAIMDREKKDELPRMQVEFIDFICIPVYKGLSKLSPSLKPLYRGCQDNRRCWQNLVEERERMLKFGCRNVIVSPLHKDFGINKPSLCAFR